MNEREIQEFKKAIQQVCQRFQMGFYVEIEECYECDGGKLRVVELVDGAEDIEALGFFDLRAEIARQRKEQEEEAEYNRREKERRRINGLLFPRLAQLFLENRTVLWAHCHRVDTVSFTEEGWQKLQASKFEPNPFRSSQLAERQLTDEHRSRLPKFWEDLEALVRQVGLLPQPIDNIHAGNRYAYFSVSPAYNDPLPDWLSMSTWGNFDEK